MKKVTCCPRKELIKDQAARVDKQTEGKRSASINVAWPESASWEMWWPMTFAFTIIFKGLAVGHLFQFLFGVILSFFLWWGFLNIPGI